MKRTTHVLQLAVMDVICIAPMIVFVRQIASPALVRVPDQIIFETPCQENAFTKIVVLLPVNMITLMASLKDAKIQMNSSRNVVHHAIETVVRFQDTLHPAHKNVYRDASVDAAIID